MIRIVILKRIIAHFIFLNFVLASGAYGQIPKETAFDTSYARKVLNDLASPDFAGRGPVSSGDIDASEYIKNGFERSGVQFFESGPYQAFSYNVNIFPGAVNFSSCIGDLIPGKHFVVHPGSPPVAGEHKLHHTAINEPGFIFFSEEILERTLNSKDIDSLVSAYDNVTGIIVKKTGKLTWWVSRSAIDKPVILISAETDLSKCDLVQLDIVSEQVNHNTRNVIGYIPGSKSAEEYILITGHYDHLGMMGTDAVFNGANDNASGIALMMTLARYYGRPDNSPPCPIVFMAFAGEEAGLIGSEYYVNNPLFPLDEIRFLINLDLMGTGEDGITVVNGSVHKEEFRLLSTLNDSGNYFAFIGERGKAANSDHYHFSEKGVPAFFIYTLGPRKAYHDIYDVSETVEFPKVSQSLQLINSFIKSLCTEERR